ncbi:hypothetical protein [Lonepinella koalarum]|uniref:hypothetical protein n=1 Tax=Lonepinella koalarum TaxID=53417 RepID=UPI001E5EA746|nr:hypothetical protein [Lonepinella koalarum]
MMKAIFIELPYFERYRNEFLTDEDFRQFQNELLADPEKGELIQHTGGLRKVRIADKQKK